MVGLLLWRRKKLEPTLLVGGLAAAVAMVVYGSGVVHFPNLDHVLERVGTTLGAWTYLLVGVMAFAETGAFVGLLAPGETVILIGGVVAGQGKINLAGLIAIIWVCAVAGDMASFWLGHRHGRDFLVRHGRRFHITEARVAQVEAFFTRRGGQSILIGRFIGLVRAVAPFLAGASGMPARQFLAYDVIGAGVWGSAFAVLGFVFWQSLDQVLAWAKKGSLVLAVMIVVVVGAIAAVKWLRDPENRQRVDELLQRLERNRVARPFIALGRPVVRWSKRPAAFALRRVTPGDLGLELTALVSIVGGAGFVFVGYLTTVHDGFLTPGDRRASQWAGDITTAWLTTFNKVLSVFGTFEAVIAALALAAAALLLRRHWPEAISLVAGFWITWAVTQVVKHQVHRARPSGALVDTSGWAFPSGHASNAVLWLAVGVAAWRWLGHGALRTTAILAGATATVAIGLSRVYLRAHWWSDVAAGWGLGVAIYGLCAVAALLIDHRRKAAAA